MNAHLSKEQLRIRTEHNSSIKDRICETDVLVIDEIGLLSAHLLEKTEFLCRTVRSTNKLFGGIQVIAAGDFRQLTPVPDNIYGDVGDPCYTAIR